MPDPITGQRNYNCSPRYDKNASPKAIYDQYYGGFGNFGATGMFAGGFVAYTFADCKDGLSNTFLMGETLVGHNPHRSYFDCFLNAASTGAPPNFGLLASDRCPVPSMHGVSGWDNWDICNRDTSGFDSMHPGGVNMATSDGAVHFMSETIDYTLWVHLGNKDDGTASSLP